MCTLQRHGDELTESPQEDSSDGVAPTVVDELGIPVRRCVEPRHRPHLVAYDVAQVRVAARSQRAVRLEGHWHPQARRDDDGLVAIATIVPRVLDLLRRLGAGRRATPSNCV